MAMLYGKRWTRKQIESLTGSMHQIAGITPGELADGRGRGVRTAEIRTGSGLSATVALDRCMDIVRADHQGRSLGWRSVVGDSHPAYYEPDGLGWLRSFTGGPVATCGLSSFGAPCEDEGEALGLHGRIGNTPAGKISVSEDWNGNEYEMNISGEMIEGAPFGTYLRLRRTISTRLGANSIMINDEVTNIGPRPGPLMILYHCNIGFPVIAPESRLIAPTIEVTGNSPEAQKDVANHAKADKPRRGMGEKVYEHKLGAKAGRSAVALVNEAFDGGNGFGLYLRFRTGQLPVFNQWKLMGESEYVMGLEPGTNGVTGRAAEREKGRLSMIKPGETRRFELEIGALDDMDEIAAIEKEISGMK